jgi:hypothetical protein
MLRSIHNYIGRVVLAVLLTVILMNRPNPPAALADCIPATGGTTCTG